jgi:2-keto-4-pentenoate hydratase/2-oxohepta-3-ene-1,7-dioic acid hydratase in catechol pathway
VEPGKIVALWNNFHALGAKLGLTDPAEPLYLLKPAASVLAPGGVIRKPRCEGKVVFEGELGDRDRQGRFRREREPRPGPRAGLHLRQRRDAGRHPAPRRLLPAVGAGQGLRHLLPLRPAIATGIDPATLVVKTFLNGELRQDYPISDMRFSVARSSA